MRELEGKGCPQYTVLDFFAGAARIARGARVLGETAAAFDISYGANGAFDFNTPAGFVPLTGERARLLQCDMFRQD